MKTEASKVRNWKRFREWLVFSLLLTGTLIVGQSVAKLLERYGPLESHGAAGSTTVGSYILSRLVLVCGVSTIVSAIATACGADNPLARTKLKTSD